MLFFFIKLLKLKFFCFTFVFLVNLYNMCTISLYIRHTLLVIQCVTRLRIVSLNDLLYLGERSIKLWSTSTAVRHRGPSDSVGSRGGIGGRPGGDQGVPRQGGVPGGVPRGGSRGGSRGGCPKPRFSTLCTISPKRPSHLRSPGPICLIIRGAPTPPSPGGTPPPGGCFGGLFRGRKPGPQGRLDSPQI